MQSLDVISINIWQVVISLANLTILFLIIKKVLYKPVLKMIAAREALAKAEYEKAEAAKNAAEEEKKQWDEKMKSADEEAERIVNEASDKAKRLSRSIEDDAKQNAERIVMTAKSDAELEYKRAHDSIRQEIADVSAEIVEKVLDKEIDRSEHHALIGSFLDSIGVEGNE